MVFSAEMLFVLTFNAGYGRLSFFLSHHDASLMLRVFCCAPQPDFFFDKVIFMWGVVFCILSFWLKDETVVMEGVSFYFPTSWCNSDVGRITFCLTSWCNSDDGICFLLCPWASLLQTRLSVMDVLSLCFLFHIKMQLWCWEDFFLPRIMILLWWNECHAVPLG